MAFGFFGSSKVGPGVDKNRPEKKRFFLFFELYFRKFGQLIRANLMFTLCLIPALIVGLAGFLFLPRPINILGITLGLALIGPPVCGMTYLLRQMSLQRPVFVWHDFIDCMKKNFKQSLLFSILDSVVITIIGATIIFSLERFNDGAFQYVLFVLYIAVALIVLIMHYYIYPMMITLALSISKLIKNALILTLAAIKTNLITTFWMLLLVIIPAALLPIQLVATFTITLVPLFYSSLIGFIILFNSFPHVKRLLVDPYYEAHPEERKNNVFGDVYEEDEDEVIFTDLGTLEPKSTLAIKPNSGRGGKTIS